MYFNYIYCLFVKQKIGGGNSVTRCACTCYPWVGIPTIQERTRPYFNNSNAFIS